MKKLTAIIGICLVACITQAKPSNNTASASATSTAPQGQSVKTQKQCDPQEILARIEKHLTERQAELQKATSNGRTDIAADLQKIIDDLNAMKTALSNKDKAAFKTANEQRKQDREALETLRKADRQANKNNKTAVSKTSNSTVKP